MKLKLSLLFLLLFSSLGYAQQNDMKNIASTNPPDAALSPLRYLASDALKGRGIELPEIDTAANYIAVQFKQTGVKALDGAPDYFQHFNLKFAVPSKNGQLTIGASSYKIGSDVVQYKAGDVSLEGTIIFAGKGTDAELAPLDVQGKIVLVDAGKVAEANSQNVFGGVNDLRKKLADKGAVALIERMNTDAAYWTEVSGYFTGSKPVDSAYTPGFPTIFLRSSQSAELLAKLSGITAHIQVNGTKTKDIALKNVLGYVAGTDPDLNKQYIMLSSHYDHLGVAAKATMEDGKLDSIYNGARDNATGTTAVIAAARYFAKFPPKRSVIFIAYTAEEEGLLGSIYYAEHPVLPLRQTVYNLNIDNASYNDTTLVSLVGIGRTSADPLIVQACQAYGLHTGGDPTGGQLFSGSDNFPLAKKGIPAPTYSLGMKTFDETITNRYHQLSDEVGNMDLNYVMKFISAYILSAKYIADADTQPVWTKGDVYDAAWNLLFH